MTAPSLSDAPDLSTPIPDEAGADIGGQRAKVELLNRFGDGVASHRTDPDAQIAAIFKEFQTFDYGRYNMGVSNGSIPGLLSYEDYLEYKHHQPNGDGGVTAGSPWTHYNDTYHRDGAQIGLDQVYLYVG